MGEVPADMDRRRERCAIVCDFKADEADDALILDPLGGPLAEAVPIEARLDVVEETVALLATQRPEAVAHDLRVGVDLGEDLTVVARPSAQQKPLGVRGRRKHRSAAR